jgi:hypothetical protein
MGTWSNLPNKKAAASKVYFTEKMTPGLFHTNNSVHCDRVHQKKGKLEFSLLNPRCEQVWRIQLNCDPSGNKGQ